MHKNICIYHGNCADGFGAAWVVRKAFKEIFKEPIDFFPAKYQESPPDVTNMNVIMVDFSYKFPVLSEMLNKCNNMVILDHHKSAKEDLDAILDDKLIKIFDMERSGAMLAWDHFFPGQEPPQLIKHIQDRDLWKFDLFKTREIQAALFSFEYDFELWDGLMLLSHESLKYFAQQGEAIERKHHKDIDEFNKVATRLMKIGGTVMPVVNCPYMWGSDAANKLAETNEPKVAGYYYDTADGRVFGLRSIGNFDCSVIAAQYGGGGHKNASGFKITSPAVAESLEVDNIWTFEIPLY